SRRQPCCGLPPRCPRAPARTLRARPEPTWGCASPATGWVGRGRRPPRARAPTIRSAGTEGPGRRPRPPCWSGCTSPCGGRTSLRQLRPISFDVSLVHPFTPYGARHLETPVRGLLVAMQMLEVPSVQGLLEDPSQLLLGD